MFKTSAIYFAFDILAVVIRGLVFEVLWGWFIVTGFGAPIINATQAIGMTLVITFLTHGFSVPDDSDENVAELIMYVIGSPIITLATGAVLRAFM